MNVQTGDVSDAKFGVVEEFWEFQRHYSLENMIRGSRYHGWTIGGKASATLGRKPLEWIIEHPN